MTTKRNVEGEKKGMGERKEGQRALLWLQMSPHLHFTKAERNDDDVAFGFIDALDFVNNNAVFFFH